MDEQTTSKGRARTEVPDTQVSGLWVRIAPSGVKTYAIRYRLHGRSARYTIGRTTNVTLKHARKHALELFDDIRRGNDPRHRKSDDVTLNKHVFIDLLVDLYVPSLRDRKRGRNLSERHISEIERRLMSSVVPRLKGRPFLTIDAHAIETVLQDIEKTAPRVAAHVYYDLKGLYAWATKRGLADTSPMIGIEPPAKPEFSRPSIERHRTRPYPMQMRGEADCLQHDHSASSTDSPAQGRSYKRRVARV